MDDSLPQLSQDSFYRGGFEVFQPVGVGHRSGSDALLLAASLPQDARGLLADLGAGAGVAALASLKSNPALEAVLVEIDPIMVGISRNSLALPFNSDLADRAKLMKADVTLSGSARQKAGLADNSFDHVIMNPPYNHPGQRSSPQPLKALAHKMAEGGLEAWLRTAAAILKPGGWVHLIYRAESLGEVISSMQGRFGAISIIPLHSKAGEKASRIIVRAKRGSRAKLCIAPGIFLHEANGKPTELADELINGRRRMVD
ncbi:MAG: tRNA1(Val) (adenine(37)-N6)-methyltransferase [Rhizobiaceae bacterium]